MLFTTAYQTICTKIKKKIALSLFQCSWKQTDTSKPKHTTINWQTIHIEGTHSTYNSKPKHTIIFIENTILIE